MKKLVEYRNDPNYKQAISLVDLCRAYEQIITGFKGWYTFLMPVGGGKTLSIVALCKALSEIPELYNKGKAHSSYEDVSILVCMSKVEALCQLKRELVEIGVPKEWIGLYHSYYYNPDKIGQPDYASEPVTEDYENKRILLTTHQRVSGRWGEQQYRLYQDNPRSIVIYDESLIKAEALAVEIRYLRAGVGFYEELASNKNLSNKAMKAFEYLKQALELVDREIEEQNQKKRKPDYVQLPQLSMEDIEEYKKALGDEYKQLHHLLDMSQEPLRVLLASQGRGVITYHLRIDTELQNIIILDASYLIRVLVKRYDREIYPIFTSNMFEPDYSNLTLYRIPIYGGRTTMEREFGKPASKRLITKEIAYIIKQIPEDEGVLIFTYKRRGGGSDFQEILKDDLKRYGVDLEAELEVEKRVSHKETEKRINLLTWGQETSLNDYAWIKNQIQVGILNMSEIHIGARIAALSGDLLMRINAEQIREVVKSEIIHCFYQALGRTYCRVITNGKAGEANVWYTDVDNNIWETLQKEGLLKNSHCKEWPLQYMDKKEQKVNELGFRIMEDLNALPVFVKTISIRKLKEHMELSDIPSSTVQRAINYAAENHTGWKKKDRSLVRT
jgi:hypothetical protein